MSPRSYTVRKGSAGPFASNQSSDDGLHTTGATSTTGGVRTAESGAYSDEDAV